MRPYQLKMQSCEKQNKCKSAVEAKLLLFCKVYRKLLTLFYTGRQWVTRGLSQVEQVTCEIIQLVGHNF